MKTAVVCLRVWCALGAWLLGMMTAHAATVSGGPSHFVVAKPDGTVWTWGFNGNAQLGDGTTTDRAVPTQVAGLTDVIAVAAGTDHTLALKSDGTLWAWGWNSNGQIGDGSTTRRDLPVPLSLTNIVAIAGGDKHSVALQSDGTVWVWGANTYGQLGTGNTTSTSTPVALTGITSVSAIDAGTNHTVALKSDGTVWAWGYNSNGQLGNGSTTNQTSPAQMTGISGATGVSAGVAHSLVLLSDGTVRATGYNGYGQIGDNSTTQRTTPVVVSGLTGVTAMVARRYMSGARRSDGTVRLWGDNGSGQLGDNTTTPRYVPTAPTGVPSGLALLTGGGLSTLAVTTDGVVWTWGANTNGPLGDGTRTSRPQAASISGLNYDWNVGTPVLSSATGTYYSSFSVTVTEATPGAIIHYTLTGDDPTESDPTVASGGTILIDRIRTLKARAWKTGMPTSRIASATYTLTVTSPMLTPPPTTYTTPQTVTMSTTTPGATIRYTTDGSPPTEASTSYTAPISVATTTTLKAAAFKADWTSSSIYTAPYTMRFGTLAAPTMGPAAGTYTSSVILTFSALSGATIYYTTNGSTPGTSSTIYTGPLTVTATTTFKAYAVHPDYNASAVTTATYTIEAATPTFTPTAGTYAAGQLITVATSTPGATITYTLNGADPLSTDQQVVSGSTLVAGNFTLKAKAWKTGTNASAVASATYAITGTNATASVAAGASHSFALRADGTLWGWGNNGNGQLGDGTSSTVRLLPGLATVTGATAVDGGTAHTVLTTTAGQGLAMGFGGSGQLGDGTTNNHVLPGAIASAAVVVGVSAGTNHSLAVTSAGAVLAWGANYGQQLGNGTTTYVYTPFIVPGLTGITAVAAGDSFSAALKSDGTVWTWGTNSDGQLGDGTTTSVRGMPAQVTLAGNIVAIAAGYRHLLALASDGTLWAWGYNQNGQVGDGSQTVRRAPVHLTGLPVLQSVAAGAWHSLALAADGTVYAWGSGGSGQLGIGSSPDAVISPTVVSGVSSIVKLAAGDSHSVALAADGTVWAWGANGNGQLGDGTKTSRLSPVAISGPGMLWQPATPVIALTSGTYFADQQAAVTCPDASATLHYTTNGVIPTETDPVIVSGASVAIAQSLTLTVRAFKTGTPPSAVASATYELKVVTPTLSPGSGRFATAPSVTIATATPGATLRYTVDTTEPATTSGTYSAPLSIDHAQTVKARGYKTGWTPSDTGYASYWISDGTVAAPVLSPAGGTYSEEALVKMTVATSDATIRYTTDGADPGPEAAIFQFGLVVRTTTTIKARAFKSGFTPSAVTSATYALDVAGAAATPTLSSNGGPFTTARTVTVTGAAGTTLRYTLTGVDPVDTDSVIASGATIALPRSLVLKVRAWAAGLQPSAVRRADFVITGALATAAQHSMALKADGTVWTWGYNYYGGLGDGVSQRLVPAQVSTGVTAIATGFGHFLVLKADGTVWAWGSNSYGQLGDNSQNTRSAPVQVAGLTDVRGIAAGRQHSLAVKGDGTVWAWGDNTDGQLGDGTTTMRMAPVQVSVVSGLGMLAAGADFSILVTTDGANAGTVWTWGGNTYGQLGDGSLTKRLWPMRVAGLSDVRGVAAGWDWAVAIDRARRTWAWGHNAYGQTGSLNPANVLTPVEVPPAFGATTVSASNQHVAALDGEARPWAWGSNGNFQIGGVDTASLTTANPVPLRAPFPGELLWLVAGQASTLMARADGTVWGIGQNTSGELGDGTNVSKQVVTAASGFQLADNSWLTGDPDHDGLSTWREYLRGTDPLNADSNGNGVTDGADTDVDRGVDPDPDGDGLSTWLEMQRGTNPYAADSDGDGVPDNLDRFPLDPTRSSLPPPDPGDTTPPTITLTEPTTARPVPPE